MRGHLRKFQEVFETSSTSAVICREQQGPVSEFVSGEGSETGCAFSGAGTGAGPHLSDTPELHHNRMEPEPTEPHCHRQLLLSQASLKFVLTRLTNA